jgi:threonine dehydratase
MVQSCNNCVLGTLALELLEQEPELDAIIAPIGGGGMISGIATAAQAKPGLRVFAAEPLGADDAHQSFVKREFIPQQNPRTIADGLLTSLGTKTWPIVRDSLEDIITVNEDEIKAALLLVWERMKLVIEPSAAVGVAAVLSEKFKNKPGMERVGVVLCGGNLDVAKALRSLFN